MNYIYSLCRIIAVFILNNAGYDGSSLVNQYGFYIPGDPWRVILFNDFILYTSIIVFVTGVLVFRKRLIALFFFIKSIILQMLHYIKQVLIKIESPRRFELDYNFNGDLDEKNAVEIMYTDNNNKTTYRKIIPVLQYTQQGYGYVKAFCFLRMDTRTFREDRIKVIKQP